MAEILSIFDCRVDFDPGVDREALLRQIPRRWAVYLFADAEDGPIQLLCVKNLRASIRRRLFGVEPVGPSKRVNYRDIVRRVYWRRVDSAFEADWVYLEAARRLFPQSYRGMTGFRLAWFVHVNPQAEFPRYTRTIELAGKAGLLIGPVPDKHAAARLIELVEDAFDLCRYYSILLAAPHGKACAYKEMGKCPAPCDGSIGMERYREMVRESARTIVAPTQFIEQQTARMKEAAAGLRFEEAARLKAKLDQAGKLGSGAFGHARLLEDFRFVSLQRGPSQRAVKVFLITPTRIEPIACLIDEPAEAGELLRYILAATGSHPLPGGPGRGSKRDAGEREHAELMMGEGAERLAITAHHLFSPKGSQGVFIPVAELDEVRLRKTYRELLKQKTAEESEEEGVVRELQAM